MMIALRNRITLLAVGLLSALATVAVEPWVTLTKCELVSNKSNDGDSFHVQHGGKEYIFRLYFVDCPETDDRFKDRVAEQAAYFGITDAAALAVGKDAARFTQKQLGKEFTVVTCWQDARGQSKLRRHYAFVLVEGKNDLAELLVRQGLARVFGEAAKKPDGTATKDTWAKLRRLEADAKAQRLGGWAATTGAKP